MTIKLWEVGKKGALKNKNKWYDIKLLPYIECSAKEDIWMDGWMDRRTDGCLGPSLLTLKPLGMGPFMLPQIFPLVSRDQAGRRGSWREHPVSQPQARPGHGSRGWLPRLSILTLSSEYQWC